MTNHAELITIVGALLPLLISVINSVSWDKPIRAVAGFAACFLVAAVTSFLNGALTPMDFVGDFSVIYAAAMVSYHGFYGPTGLSNLVENTILPRAKSV